MILLWDTLLLLFHDAAECELLPLLDIPCLKVISVWYSDDDKNLIVFSLLLYGLDCWDNGGRTPL